MKLTELFEKGTYVLTSEVGPVKGCVRERDNGDAAAFLQEADLLRDHIHAINVTDNQSAVMRLGSLAGSIKLKGRGIEPLYQISCRDRNRLALQSELLSAYSLGVDNVLVLTGDYTTLGDHPGAKPVFDLDSVQLIKTAVGLRNGLDMQGNELTSAPDFAVGAVVNPNFEPLDLQLMKMEKKVEAGAEFFQTQPVYDPTRFEAFMRKAGSFGVPIQLGLVLVKSAKMAKFMNDHISGITVPDAWMQELKSTPDGEAKSKCVEMTVRLIREVGPLCQGIHFMPLGWSDVVPRIIKEAIDRHS